MVYENAVFGILIPERAVLNILYFQGPSGEQGPRGEVGLKGDKVGGNATKPHPFNAVKPHAGITC